ncbi:Aryl sulfotransferase family protein [Penicillium ucsense]|uniref:Aryl sulfotransferase family protein n=1 Tax=Penicillium ucsense TaxID=2839758 RepID=A0A8J8W7K0_9EURO|nr:Aryl sulfotransferase family protein [Penicillium ucsense]KAF7738277.1 Aryl sulfotransferase family protein [Penicillium ucsense]
MFFVGALSLLLLQSTNAQRHDADLMSFMTLPEVRALKWEITHHDLTRAAPGYWFVAPYGQISPEEPTKKYQQYQVGPYIYDGDGMLIWAGAPLYDNRNVFDFRPVTNIDGETHLSFIVNWDIDYSNKGHGVVLDKNYKVEKDVNMLLDVHDFNMHEFNVLPGGKSALACTYREQEVNLVDFDRPEEKGWVVSGGFVEMDLETNEILAQWDSLDKIPLHESVLVGQSDAPAGPPGWDYVHINAVDKNEAGDYIISMRFTDTIYGISGEDGHIMWRLGGRESDFEMDFTFSKQHDVKFVSSNGTHHVISFLNNASFEQSNEENLSSALFVELDTAAMTARVVRRINRPDSGLTRLRGSVQLLPNDNVFVGWSEWGYQSEHAPNGDLLMTARFASERYSTYRAYKGEFVGRPTSPPDVVASVYGTRDDDTTTLIHVSWNGATDIARWNFYARAHAQGSSVLIGHAEKHDFETMYILDGYMDWITAEAIDKDGKVLGTSQVIRSEVPQNWKAVGFTGSTTGPTPDDPALVAAIDKSNTHPSSSGAKAEDQASTGSSDSSSAYADAKEVAKAVNQAYQVVRNVGALLVLILLVCIVAGIVVGVRFITNRRKTRSYQHVPAEEGVPVEAIPLRSHGPE